MISASGASNVGWFSKVITPSPISEPMQSRDSKDDRLKSLCKKVRIGLVSPYSGSNMGDAAIIEAARELVSRSIPGVEFLAIVIDVERVSRLHGMQAFPLTSVPRPFYFSPSQPLTTRKEQAGPEWAITKPRHLHTWARSLLKKVARPVPYALPIARSLRSIFRTAALDLGHLREARRMVTGLDALVVTGGGQFDDEYGGPWGHPYALLKLVSLARWARVPVYLVGVGVCEIRYCLTGLFLRLTLSQARRISLRDGGSLDLLRTQRISRELSLCPDLAFGLWTSNGNSPRQEGSLPEGTSTIGLSPIVFDRPGGWPTEDAALFQRYWAEFENLSALLLADGYRLQLFVTDDADFPLARDLHERLLAAGTDREKIRLLPVSTLPELLTCLETCDAVIASRLHGALLSHVRGVPVLAISYHRKVRAHMVDMEQGQFCLDFETFTAGEARGVLRTLFAHREDIVRTLSRVGLERRLAVEHEVGVMAGEVVGRVVGAIDQRKGKEV